MKDLISNLRPAARGSILFFSVFAIAFSSRLILLSFLASPEYHFDDALDSCIKAWQLSDGEELYAKDNLYLPIFLFSLAPRIFGFSVFSAQIIAALSFSLSMTILFFAVRRLFGDWTAVFGLLMSLVLLPYVARSVFPTTAISSFWFPPLILLLLSYPITPLRASALGFVAGLSLLAYTAGAIFSVSLLALHNVFFARAWQVRARVAAALFLIIALALVVLFRNLIQGDTEPLKWGIHSANLLKVFATAPILLKEIFISANSWYSFSAKAPYVTWELRLLLLATTGWALVNLLGPRRLTRDRALAKWLILLVCAVALSVLFAALAPSYPGIRRLLPAVLVLIVSGGAFFEILNRYYNVPAWGLLLGISVVVASVTTRTIVNLDEVKLRPVYANQPFVRAAINSLPSAARTGEVVFVLMPGKSVDIGRNKQLADATACGIGLDAAVRSVVDQVHSIALTSDELRSGETLESSLVTKLAEVVKGLERQSALLLSHLPFNPDMSAVTGAALNVVSDTRLLEQGARPGRLVITRLSIAD